MHQEKNLHCMFPAVGILRKMNRLGTTTMLFDGSGPVLAVFGVPYSTNLLVSVY